MNKQAKRIIANVVDFDMHNLFPSMTPMENLEDAASGEFTSQPKKTLRERPYTSNPIKVVPKYEGDFLEKLKKPLEGKPVMPVETVVRLSGNPENLLDFKGPDDILKHQEKPHPRNLVDQYYEMTKPGEEAGQDVLDDLYDRGWDNEDAPEMSEDKVTRMFKSPVRSPIGVPFRSASQRVASSFLEGECCSCPSTGVVISNFLQDCFIGLEIDPRPEKVAVLMKELANAKIHTKARGTRSPGGAAVTVDTGKGPVSLEDAEEEGGNGPILTSVPGVTVKAKRYEPAAGRWTFTTSSGTAPKNPWNKNMTWPWPYTTSFQFIPYKNVRNTYNLHVRVSCTCPSWLFWGAQFNAYMNDYLYGGIRPKFAPPKTRDKNGNFLVCKHVLACLPLVSKFRLGEMAIEKKHKLEKVPHVKILAPIPEEVLRMPKELEAVGKRPHIAELEKNWDLKPRSRASLIKKLDEPEEVWYLVHRHPEASHLLAKRVKEIAKIPKEEKKALQVLEKVEEIERKMPKIIVPPEVQSLETDPEFINGTAGWTDKNEKAKSNFISNEKNPDIVALIGAKNPSDVPTITLVVKRLKEIADNDDFLDIDRRKAVEREKWFI